MALRDSGVWSPLNLAVCLPLSQTLKSSSPQMTLEDIEIISAVLAGSAIREGFGK
jgi:hypothetical protein